MKEDREKLSSYFQYMKELEESTRDYYKKVSLEQNFDDQEIKDTFEKISKEEQEHTEIIGKIIMMIKNTL